MGQTKKKEPVPASRGVIVNDEVVLSVLARAGRPLTTQEVAVAVGSRVGAQVEQVPMSRLRRALDRLEKRTEIIGSGGPVRAALMGWPDTDGRDVQWATIDVANEIREDHRRAVAENVARLNRRNTLLRDLHRTLDHKGREALRLVGVGPRITADVEFQDPEGGATTWTLEELEAVMRAIKEARSVGRAEAGAA